MLFKSSDYVKPSIITGHRPPTAYEIRFGEGATHYKDFDRDQWEIFTVGGKRQFSDFDVAQTYAQALHAKNGTIAAI
jgi:hypothetical protein